MAGSATGLTLLYIPASKDKLIAVAPTSTLSVIPTRGLTKVVTFESLSGVEPTAYGVVNAQLELGS